MSARTSRQVGLPLLASLAIASCSGGGPAAPAASGLPISSPPLSSVVSGVVSDGSNPVAGASIAAYAAQNAAELPASRLGAATTDSGGRFSIGVPASAGAADIVYIEATGGSVGAVVRNPALRLMTVANVGCAGSPGGCQFPGNLKVNALTTVAAAYTLAPFLRLTSTDIQVGGVAPGLGNAVATFDRLVDPGTGVASTTLQASCNSNGDTVDCAALQTINTLANRVASCADAAGSSASVCSDFLAAAGNAPDTLSALLAVVTNPAIRNDGPGIFGSVPAPAMYAPALSAAPADWTLALRIARGGLSQPTGIAVDSSGDIWVSNNVSPGTVTKLSAAGQVLSPSGGFTGGGLDGPIGLAIDQNDNVWVANWAQGSGRSVTELAADGTPLSGAHGFTGGGLDGPIAVAVTSNGGVVVANYSNASLTGFSALGVASGPYTGGGLSFPVGLALDGAGNAWVANQGGDSVSEFDSSLMPISSSAYGGGGLAQPTGIAVDPIGNIHVANFGTNRLSILIGGSTPMSCGSPPSSGQTGCPLTPNGFSRGGLNGPNGVAVDGAGHSWIPDLHGNAISEFDAAGMPLSPATGYGSAMLDQPYAAAVDAAGNLWVTNFGNNSVVQFIGIATPVKTPLIGLPAAP